MKITTKQLKRIIREYGEPYVPGSGQREVPRGDGFRSMIARLAQETMEYYSGENFGASGPAGMTLEDAMEQVLQDEDLHKDAMVRGHLRSELFQNETKARLKSKLKRIISESVVRLPSLPKGTHSTTEFHFWKDLARAAKDNPAGLIQALLDKGQANQRASQSRWEADQADVYRQQLEDGMYDEYLGEAKIVREHLGMKTPVSEDTAEAFDMGYIDGTQGLDRYMEITKWVDSGEWTQDMLDAWEEGYDAGREEAMGSASDFDW